MGIYFYTYTYTHNLVLFLFFIIFAACFGFLFSGNQCYNLYTLLYIALDVRRGGVYSMVVGLRQTVKVRLT